MRIGSLSTSICVYNQTIYDLFVKSHSFKWGYWEVRPSDTIEPGKLDNMLSNDSSGAWAGSEGTIVYEVPLIDGSSQITIKYCCSFGRGGNYVSVSNTNPEALSVEFISYAGDLSDANAKWLHNKCDPHNDPLQIALVIKHAEDPQFFNVDAPLAHK